jgi:hypothetical protein
MEIVINSESDYDRYVLILDNLLDMDTVPNELVEIVSNAIMEWDNVHYEPLIAPI